MGHNALTDLSYLATIAHRAKQARENGERDLYQAVKQAKEEGATLQQIADVLGVTRQRIWQILHPK